MRKTTRAEWSPSDVSLLIQYYSRYKTPRKIIESCPELVNKFTRSQIQTKIANLKKQGPFQGKLWILYFRTNIQLLFCVFFSLTDQRTLKTSAQSVPTSTLKRKRAEEMMRRLKEFNMVNEWNEDTDVNEDEIEEEEVEENNNKDDDDDDDSDNGERKISKVVPALSQSHSIPSVSTMPTNNTSNFVPPFIIRDQNELYLLWRVHSMVKISSCVNTTQKIVEVKMVFPPPVEKEINVLPIDRNTIRSAYLSELVYSMDILLPSDADLTHQERLRKYTDDSFQGLIIPMKTKKDEKFIIQ